MANVTDKFTKAEEQWSTTIGSGGVADASTTTIPLSSVTDLPTDTAIYLAIDRVDSNGDETPGSFEVVKGTVSGDNLDCDSASYRGIEGTAQSHSAGAVVEFLATASQWNAAMEGILEEHNQDGTHKKVTGMDNDQYITGNNNAGDGEVNMWKVNTSDEVETAGDVVVPDAKDIKFSSGAKIERDGGDIKLTPESGGKVSLGAGFFDMGAVIKKIQRDLTASAGDVSYTGYGFQPTSLVLFGTVNTTSWSLGSDDGSTPYSMQYRPNGSWARRTSYSAYLESDTADYQSVLVKSFDSDGFTLTYGKGGSPTGTGDLYVIAFQ